MKLIKTWFKREIEITPKEIEDLYNFPVFNHHLIVKRFMEKIAEIELIEKSNIEIKNQ